MSELAQKLNVRNEKPESAITAAERASTTPEQTTKNVNIVPISQVLKLTAPDGKDDEVICYGKVEDLGEGATMSKAQIVPMEIAGLMDPDEPKANQSSTKRAIAATIAAFLGGGTVVAAVNGCNANSGSDTAMSQMKKNLTSTDYANTFQDQGVACFSQAGDGPLSIGELPNGDKIIVFVRDDGNGDDHCFGVTAPDYQTAVTQECTAQDIPIEGLMSPGNPYIVNSCTADGTRLAAVRNGETLYYDLNVTGGTINTSNPWTYAGMNGASLVNFIRDGGQQRLLTNKLGVVNVHDIDTQTDTPTTVPVDYGLPHKDDAAGIWMRARMSGGNVIVVQSPTSAGLASSIVQIQGIPQDSTDPRGGDTMFFFNAADGNHYAIVLPYCGDGTCNNGETNATCPGDCPSTGVCGDGNLDAGEVCDDNNTVDGDGCSADCLSDETCGNNVTDTAAGEVCDDGNNIDGDGCSADCLSDETCGNNVTDTAAGEVCDDGNTTSGDGCSADCQSDETCGNNVTDTAAGEVCDDGNNIDGDGCSADCLSDETCGNGICDTDANEDFDTCPVDCEGECGDGVCDPTEDNTTCPAECPPECQEFIQKITWKNGTECPIKDCDANVATLYDDYCEGQITLVTGHVIDFVVRNGECRLDAQNGNMEPLEYMTATPGMEPAVDDKTCEFTTNGHTFNLKVQNGNTVVSGTRVRGGLYHLTTDGRDDNGMFIHLREGATGVEIDAQEVDQLECSPDDVKRLYNLETREEEPLPGTDPNPDGGVGDGGIGNDAGNGDDPGPGCNRGCNTSNENGVPFQTALFLAGLAIAIARRRRQAKIADKPTSVTDQGTPEEGSGLEIPGVIAFEHAKNWFQRTFLG